MKTLLKIIGIVILAIILFNVLIAIIGGGIGIIVLIALVVGLYTIIKKFLG